MPPTGSACIEHAVPASGTSSEGRSVCHDFVASAQLLQGFQRHDRDAERVVRDDVLDRTTGGS